MHFETAESVYDEIRESQLPDQALATLKGDLIKSAVRYARIRTDWRLERPEARNAMSSDRTLAHDACIDSCNALSRFMANNGLPTAWRSRLGQDRKEIGDFACYLHCILGIMAR